MLNGAAYNYTIPRQNNFLNTHQLNKLKAASFRKQITYISFEEIITLNQQLK